MLQVTLWRIQLQECHPVENSAMLYVSLPAESSARLLVIVYGVQLCNKSPHIETNYVTSHHVESSATNKLPTERLQVTLQSSTMQTNHLVREFSYNTSHPVVLYKSPHRANKSTCGEFK